MSVIDGFSAAGCDCSCSWRWVAELLTKNPQYRKHGHCAILFLLNMAKYIVEQAADKYNSLRYTDQ